MAAMSPNRKFVKATKEFLGRKEPEMAGAAYELAITMTPDEMMDFITLFRMTMGTYVNLPVNYTDSKLEKVWFVGQAMTDAADNAMRNGGSFTSFEVNERY
jgi:hypothetical protein